MDATSWFVTISTVAFGVFVSVALGVLGVSRAHHRIARLSCWGAAISLWVLVIVFGVTVSLPSSVRYALTFVAFGLIGAGVLRTIGWIDKAALGQGSGLDYSIELKCQTVFNYPLARSDRPTLLGLFQDYTTEGFDIMLGLYGSYQPPPGVDNREKRPSIKCSVSNLSQTAISSIKLVFKAQLLKSEKTDNGLRSTQDVLAERTFVISDIDFSPQFSGSDYFFLLNTSTDKFVVVVLPTSAMVIRAGSEKEETVKLIKRTGPLADLAFISPMTLH